MDFYDGRFFMGIWKILTSLMAVVCSWEFEPQKMYF